MTTWLSTSNPSDHATRARGSDGVVLCAALAVLIAIVLYLVVSPSHPIAQDAAATLAGP
jgi:hypothetical protein